MTTCQQIVEFLSAYLDGDLDTETMRHFKLHIDDCPPCVSYVQSFQAMIAAVGRIPTVETMPVELQDRLHRFLAANLPKRY
jgi:anti-sigma factor (TIGR02949 family)